MIKETKKTNETVAPIRVKSPATVSLEVARTGSYIINRNFRMSGGTNSNNRHCDYRRR